MLTLVSISCQFYSSPPASRCGLVYSKKLLAQSFAWVSGFGALFSDASVAVQLDSGATNHWTVQLWTVRHGARAQRNWPITIYELYLRYGRACYPCERASQPAPVCRVGALDSADQTQYCNILFIFIVIVFNLKLSVSALARVEDAVLSWLPAAFWLIL